MQVKDNILIIIIMLLTVMKNTRQFYQPLSQLYRHEMVFVFYEAEHDNVKSKISESVIHLK